MEKLINEHLSNATATSQKEVLCECSKEYSCDGLFDATLSLANPSSDGNSLGSLVGMRLRESK